MIFLLPTIHKLTNVVKIKIRNPGTDPVINGHADIFAAKLIDKII